MSRQKRIASVMAALLGPTAILSVRSEHYLMPHEKVLMHKVCTGEYQDSLIPQRFFYLLLVLEADNA